MKIQKYMYTSVLLILFLFTLANCESPTQTVLEEEVTGNTTNAVVTLFAGADNIHQSIRDTLLPDVTVIATISELTTGVEYTYSWGHVNETKIVSNGMIEITKADLQNTSAGNNTELRLSRNGEDILVASYKPMEIYSWQDLQAMRVNLSGDYTLINDITFPVRSVDGFPQTGFEPIGVDTTKGDTSHQGLAFSGTLDGNNKSINNLQIDDPTLNYAGLFGKIESTSSAKVVVKDLNIINPFVSANAIAGTLAGFLHTGTVNNVKISNTDVSYKLEAKGKIIASDVFPNNFVSGAYVGGLIGALGSQGIVESASSTIPVSSTSFYVGGLVGYNKGKITGYSSAAVSSTDNFVGGLVGSNHSIIVGYASGTVDGKSNVGGLAGYNTGTITGYTNSIVTGISDTGGFTGYNNGTIIGYARSKVIRGTTTPNTNTNLKFGLFASRAGIDVTAYRSYTESIFEGFGITEITTGFDGTVIAVVPTSTQTDFANLLFGSNLGMWTWVEDGKWPAINIGIVKPAAEQPITPVYPMATAPPAATTITKDASSTTDTLVITWVAGILTASHYADTSANLKPEEVSHKVYAVEKAAGNRTAEQVKSDASKTMDVAAEILTATIDGLNATTAYEIVIEAINTTANTLTSLSVVTILSTN